MSMYIPTGSLVSFFSSGFPSHVRAKAIDVSSPDFHTFYSPVEGEVIDTEKIRVGRPNRFAEVDYDYVILIRQSNGNMVKILHVRPFTEKGEYVKEGQPLGEFILTPYTGGDFPHAHIEGVRISFPKISMYRESLRGIIKVKTRDYFDVMIEDYAQAGKFRGLGCCGGLLNASIPYACYGGLIGGYKEPISLFGIHLGKIYRKRKNYAIFEGKRGLIRNWEFDSSFKVLENKPICGKAFMEVVLSYGGFPYIRFFSSTVMEEGDLIDLRSVILKGFNH